jgi:AraC-like DNA-binding protein
VKTRPQWARLPRRARRDARHRFRATAKLIRMNTLSVSPPGADQAPATTSYLGLLRELAELIERHAPGDGVHETAIRGVCVIRMSAANAELVHAMHQPAVCFIAQGAKQVLVRDEVYAYDASRFLVVSVDLPVSAQVTEATPQVPYLCFRLDLDPGEIAALLLKPGMPTVEKRGPARGLYLSRTSEPMLDAVIRLMRLLDAPADAVPLASLAVQEILYRLLRSEEGERLARIGRSGSNAHRVGRVIAWLKTHFAEPLGIEHLADEVHMSVSSLHHHFRAVTAMSPLQYQKQLRLQEARRLLLSESVDAATAGHRVGYESPSHFSREYARLFGEPPSRDLQRLRQGGAAMSSGA